jgi:uncharacterized protein (TIGR02453 family)
MDQKVLSFLTELNLNNNREWFTENKASYDEVRNDFMSTIDQIILGLGTRHPEFLQIKAKDTIFRIYRDVRFSKDKLPYKTHFGAFITPGGRKSNLGGFYLHVEPGNSFLAGGVYHPQPDDLKAIRSEIYFNLTEFEEIVNESNFKALFGEIRGDKLKRPPVGFPKDFPGIEYLQFKDFTVLHPLSDQELFHENFIEKALTVFESMSRFNSFLNRGMDNKPDL